jgi:Family of unknown function (DUF695)
MTLSISGGDDDWTIFSKTAQSGNKLLFRSRTRSPAVQAFASENQMMRVRCVLREDQVADSGMPKSSKDIEDYEDRLIDKLKETDAEVYLVAAVTGEGNRDLFFAARDLDDLRAAIKASDSDIDTFKVQYAPIADVPPFLKMLTLSDDDLAKATFHGVPTQGGSGRGGLLGKLLGR